MINFESLKLKVNEKEVTIGAILKSDGSTAKLKTGSWRVRRPVFNFEKCVGCGTCWVFCPEGCIKKREDGKFEPDYDYCKGCGICSEECPVKAIEMVMEER
ncbi:MAG TPA: 4Fe-4S dicluster domain-containing protein [Candidatus Altiarchaeales archaeon]|mgnify:CR=1 FL=1|nr:MAG: pyruvate synthase [Candidatus Altiarchaeales archaeon]HDN82798.1 4Fe-4S dicluster domain-containing protein [Candidatus Altiarchaeales archaeon]